MFALGVAIGLFVGFVFGMFKLVIMFGCEITEIIAGVVAENIKKAAEAQPSYRAKEV